MLAASFIPTAAQQTEKLGRAAVAVKTDAGVYLSWRCLAEDADKQGYDIYRDGVKINREPITQTTNYTDGGGTAGSEYVIKTVNEAGEVTVETAVPEVWAEGYKKVHLDRPEGGTTPDGVSYTYSPNDCSVGDVDGDGEYEIIVKWDPSNSHDNSERGAYTGNVYIDAYETDGTKLWRIDLGRNIRAGAHYTQFMVYDLDGDGRAEVACKTAPGTIDGQGKAVLMGDDKVTDDYRISSGSNMGIIMSGPEYLTVFSGQTGAELTTVSYVPLRSVRTNSQWGDSYGNRSERYLACIAYLDGQKPSLVMCRGYYTAAYVCAWDFDGQNLTQRWLHSSETAGEGLYAEGSHCLSVGDVDGDGCDEIVYGAACLDHDGTLLYRTGAGHGDALHLGDFDPDREGLEVWMVHEEKKSPYQWDAEFRDARTGEIIWGLEQSGNDIGRGLIADLSDKWRGCEAWPISDYSSGSKGTSTFDCKGNKIAGKRPSCNFRIYWDGDLQEELLDGTTIEKLNEQLTGTAESWPLAGYSNAASCNSTKKTPNLQADILGDWREEVILHDGSTEADLLIFTTTEETQYRVPCLMQDHNYRMAVAWQNVAYNQPPHLGYYLPDRYSTAAQLRSVGGSLNQTVELGESIGEIKYMWVNATGVEAEGLPDGVTMTTDAETGTLTINGTPTQTGTYTYEVTTTGGETTASVSGTITVRDKVELTPVAAYHFDELAGGSTPNTVEGSAEAVGSPAATEGMAGGAVMLDGSSYFTQQAYDRLQLGEQDFTIEFWMKSTDNAAYIFHKGSISASSAAGTTGKWIGLEYKNGLLKFAIDDNSTKSEASADGTPYFNGEWAYIVCVRDSYTKTLKLYVNGTLAGESTDLTGDISDNNEPLTVGNVNVTFDNFFTGVIDEFAIYTGAMSAGKVKERYNSFTPTGITGITVGKPSGSIYTIGGVYVGTDASRLPEGVYITDGKKFVVR